MIRSIFILNKSDILMERHYTQPVSREIPQQFCLIASQYPDINDVPSILQVLDHVVAHYTCEELTFLGIVGLDCNAYAPLQFLARLTAIFQEYGGCTIENVNENYFVLYQLLEEVCDGGFPLSTDLTVLQKIVPQSKSWDEMFHSTKNQPKTTSMQSNILTDLPNEAITVNWRPKDTSHPIQSFGTDFFEQMYIVQDESGITKASALQGRMDIDCRMSGSPEITLQFIQPTIILDASLAKNVQITAWNRDKTLQIQPLDGHQSICCYKSQVEMKRVPLEFRVEQQLKSNKKEYTVTVSYNSTILQKGEFGTPHVDTIQVTIPLADYNMINSETHDGSTQLNLSDASRWVLWNVDLNKENKAVLKLKLEARKQGHIARLPIVKAKYFVMQYLVSGLNIQAPVFVNSSGKVFEKKDAQTMVEVEIKC